MKSDRSCWHESLNYVKCTAPNKAPLDRCYCIFPDLSFPSWLSTLTMQYREARMQREQTGGMGGEDLNGHGHQDI